VAHALFLRQYILDLELNRCAHTLVKERIPVLMLLSAHMGTPPIGSLGGATSSSDTSAFAALRGGTQGHSSFRVLDPMRHLGGRLGRGRRGGIMVSVASGVHGSMICMRIRKMRVRQMTNDDGSIHFRCACEQVTLKVALRNRD
jgi:hypothetical protein